MVTGSLKGSHDADLCALRGTRTRSVVPQSRFDSTLTVVYQPHPLVNTAQAEAGMIGVRMCRIESMAVVDNGQLDHIVRSCQHHAGVRCRRMLRDIAQRFLSNTVKTERGIALNPLEIVVSHEGRLDAVLSSEFAAVISERRNQADVMEHAWVEIV
jgi:hypothetical protein